MLLFFICAAVSLICNLWVVVKIWPVSKLYSFIAFIFFPAAIFFMIAQWGDEERGAFLSEYGGRHRGVAPLRAPDEAPSVQRAGKNCILCPSSWAPLA